MNPLITVMIPAFNAEKNIIPCINSLLCQSYENIQILIVDDGSTDSTYEICKNFAMKDNRIKLVHQDNSGEGAARNKGIKEADGDYLSFVDADDYVEFDFIENFYRIISQEHIDMAICGYTELKNDILLFQTQGETMYLSPADAMELLLKESYYRGYVWNKLFSMEIIKRDDICFDPSLAIWTDVLFVFRYMLKCEKIIYDPNPKYYYIYLESSASHSGNHILGVEKSYCAIRAQQMIERELDKNFEKVELKLNLRMVQSALAVIRNIGYQGDMYPTIFRECRNIIQNRASKVQKMLTKKEKILVLICKYVPGILMQMYKIKVKGNYD